MSYEPQRDGRVKDFEIRVKIQIEVFEKREREETESNTSKES